jgi:hypothetical protein
MSKQGSVKFEFGMIMTQSVSEFGLGTCSRNSEAFRNSVRNEPHRKSASEIGFRIGTLRRLPNSAVSKYFKNRFGQIPIRFSSVIIIRPTMLNVSLF